MLCHARHQDPNQKGRRRQQGQGRRRRRIRVAVVARSAASRRRGNILARRSYKLKRREGARRASGEAKTNEAEINAWAPVLSLLRPGLILRTLSPTWNAGQCFLHAGGWTSLSRALSPGNHLPRLEGGNLWRGKPSAWQTLDCISVLLSLPGVWCTCAGFTSRRVAGCEFSSSCRCTGEAAFVFLMGESQGQMVSTFSPP